MDTVVGAEPRATALRGLLRYWTRALYGCGAEKAPVWPEADLFGTCAGSQGRGSEVKVALGPGAGGATKEWLSPRDLAIRYLLFPLAGMRVQRFYLPPEAKFPLRLTFRHPRPDGDLLDALRNAFFAASFLGGLGARSRRGAGAFAVEFGPVWAEFFQCDASDAQGFGRWLGERLAEMVRARRTQPPGAPQPSPLLAPEHATVWVGPQSFRGWEGALCHLGEKMATFRGDARFGPETGAVRGVLRGAPDRSLSGTVERAAFGLPLAFRFRGHGTVNVVPQDSDRRSSPVWFTLNRLARGGLVLTATLFHGRFLEEGRRLHLKAGRNEAQAPPPDLSVVEEFVGRGNLDMRRIWP